ncbi:MAG: ABC transporter ATP-binding protein [Lachnospiraceae bacterium]|nr:ABC transporter ATP-binding protein [Lachnospiraceae bacterium]
MADVIIRTRDLVKRYGDITAVDHLNLDICRGEVFGLLGPNGAGKTTTTLMLLGLTDPTSGHAWIDGHDCTRSALTVKKEVGYLPDNVGFYGDMTGRENLVFTGEMNGLTKKEANERATGLLERVGMTFAADRNAGTYSRGMRQRLGIADVLMKDPKIIIMDEPTLGIDPAGMHELTALIRELSVKDGRTILISSHELYQIQAISDRVGIFVDGKMIACGRIGDLGRQLQNEGLYMLDIKAEKEGMERAASDSLLQTILKGIPDITVLKKQPDGSLHIEAKTNIEGSLLAVLVGNGFVLREMHERGGDLDEIYRKYFEKAGESDGGTDTEQSGTEKHGLKEDVDRLLHRSAK